MPYRELYDYCQGLDAPVGRNAIRQKLEELFPDSPLKFFKDALDRDKVQGYFLSARNAESRFVQQAGGKNVIVLCRDLNYCWERFIAVKEMMHLFDDTLQSTGSATDLEQLLTSFWGDSDDMCPQMISEVNCFWMALGLLCPEQLRLDLQTKRVAGHISDLEIAQVLKVPERYVPQFFHARFKINLGRLLD